MSNTEVKPVTHWKRLTNPLFIGAHDLQPKQELVITIKSVAQEMVKGQDGKDEQVVVAQIEGAKKPMILNKTNMKIITKVLDTPYIEEWSGKKIIIYGANVRAFGEMCLALRVKNQKVS
jgi:hypothetical protein